MTIEFDDLIPKQDNSIGFDDLIPQKKPEAKGFFGRIADAFKASSELPIQERIAQQVPLPLQMPLRAAQAVQALMQPKPESVLQNLPADPGSFDFAAASQVARKLDDVAARQQEFGTIGPIKGPQASPAAIAQGLATDLVAGGKNTRAGLNIMAGDIANAIGQEGAAQRFIQQGMRERGQAGLLSASSTPEFDSDTARGIYGGLSSLVRQGPSLAAAVLTRNPNVALGGMVAPLVPEEYGKFRERGGKPLESLVGAVGNAGVEYLTEKLPMGFFVNKMGKAGAGEFLSGLLARELPGEQVATLVQDAIDTAVANPNKTWSEYWQERPSAAYQTALATITQASLMGAGNAALNRLSRPKDEGQGPAQGPLQALDQFLAGRKLSNAIEADSQGLADQPVPTTVQQTVARIMGQPLQTQTPSLPTSLAPAPATSPAVAIDPAAPAPTSPMAAEASATPSAPSADPLLAQGQGEPTRPELDLVRAIERAATELPGVPAPAPAPTTAPATAAAPATTPTPAAEPVQAAAAVADAAARFGMDGNDITEGGKPFKTRAAANRARKLQPMMRVVSHKGGGFVLAYKTPAQLAAEEKAARRLAQPTVGERGRPMAAHEFIASEGGLQGALRKELGIEGNPRIGNRSLYAGAGKGLSIEQAAEKLQQAGYIQDDSHNAVLALIRRSITDPQFTPEGWEQVAQKEQEAQFEDYLAAQQDAAQAEDADPFDTLASVGFVEDDSDGTGFWEADQALQAEVSALAAQLEAMGQDPYDVLDPIIRANPNATQDQYNELAKQALTQAIAQAAQPAGRRDSGQDDGQQGQARGQDQSPAQPEEGLSADQVALTAAQIRRREDQRTIDPRVDTVAAQEAYLQGIARDNPEQAAAIASELRADPQAFSEIAGAPPDIIGRYASIIERQLALQGQNDNGDLQSYSAQDVEDRLAKLEQAEKERQAAEREAERRAQADAQRDDFVLTGSNRDADVAAARGQQDIFGSMSQEQGPQAPMPTPGMTPAQAVANAFVKEGSTQADGQEMAKRIQKLADRNNKAITLWWNPEDGELVAMSTDPFDNGVAITTVEPTPDPRAAKKPDAQDDDFVLQDIPREPTAAPDDGKRVLQRSHDNLLPHEQAAFDEFLADRDDADRILRQLETHKGTPWAKQAVEGIFTRQAMKMLIEGRKPTFQSSLDSGQVTNIRQALQERGLDGMWARLELNGGLMGAAAKPVNNVNSSFVNCDPSADCAKYCYATRGNYQYANVIVKSELVTLAVELDPVRSAQRVANEYKATFEFANNKALRLFDKGDGNSAWIPFIKELNRQGIRVQIFSKVPEFLRQVPDMNLRLLSIDNSNMELADANQDLPVAFVYTGKDQIDALATMAARNQIQVVLPVKLGQKLLDGTEITDLKKAVPEVKPYLCPIDAGFKPLGKTSQPGTWNCTKCDVNGGVGCFHGNATKAIMNSLEVQPSTQQERAQRILALRRKINEINAAPGETVAETGRNGPGRAEGLLFEVDALLGELLREYEQAGDRQGAAGSGRGIDPQGERNGGPVPGRRVIPIRAANARAADTGQNLQDLSQRQPVTSSPQFLAWFGDSKIVDANGQPLVMYHGTHQGGFDVFKPGSNGNAIFVAPTPDEAETFGARHIDNGDAGAVTVMPVYVKAENPFDYENSEHVDAVVDELNKTTNRWGQPNGRGMRGDLAKGDWETIESNRVHKAIKDAGFDGFYVKENDVKNLAVFSANQVKSSIGNNGNFSSANPSILSDMSGLQQDGGLLGSLPEAVRANTLARLKAIQRRLDDGRITADKYIAEVQAVMAQIELRNQAKAERAASKDRERGPDWIIERLMRAKRKGELDADTVDFALWALEKNPALATDLAISLPGQSQAGAAGDYNPAARLVRLFKEKANTTTGVHEILHHSERMMPAAVQAGIQREWERAWAKAYASATPAVRKALDDMLLSNAGDKAAYKSMRQAFANGTLSYDQHYQLVNASEFWAVNATDIMAKRYAARGSWVMQAKQWLREMVERIKAILGMRSDAPLLKGLKAVLEGDGQFNSKNMLMMVSTTVQQPGADTVMVNGVRRPALDSTGQRLHPSDEGVKNFWSWYSGSDEQDGPAQRAAGLSGQPARGRANDERGNRNVNALQRPAGLGADAGVSTLVDGQQVLFEGTTGPVGESGRPLVLYHGTRDDIQAFDLNHPNRKDRGWLGRGVYASSSQERAELYADQKRGDGSPNVMPVYMAVRNPYKASAQDKARLMKASQQAIDTFTQSLKDQGYDGVVMETPEGDIELVAFESTQVKSAIGNDGSFDGYDPSIVSDIPRNSVQSAAAPWTVPEPGAGDAFIRAIQNNKIDVKRVRDAIREQFGRMPDAVDAYLNEELYHGKVAARVEALHRDSVEPILAKIAVAGKNAGVTLDDVNLYLHARHAPERNAAMQAINPGLPNNAALSGMSDQEAAKVMADMQAAGKRQALDTIARDIDTLLADVRNGLVADGLEDAGVVQAWESAYQHYVPLQRDMGAEQAKGTGRGMGFSVRGPEAKRAVGSNREVVNILANIVTQAETAAIRAEKAEVGRALLRMAMQYPNADFWTVDKPPTKPRVNPDTGLVERNAIDPMYQTADNVIMVKHYGTEHFIVFNKQSERAMSMARAMKNLDIAPMNKVLQVANTATKFMAMLLTARNPEFWLTNFSRDIQGALINLDSTEAEGMQARMLANLPLAFKGMHAVVRGGTNSQWARYAKELQEAGGMTGYIQSFENSDKRMADLQKQIDRMQQGKADPRRLARLALDFIDDYNDIIENAVRLSAFQAARQAGVSTARAASIAKNITVNFNRKGNLTPTVNALYMFFNASVQGTARLVQAVATSRRTQAVVGSIAVLGFVMDLVNRMMAGDDEETRRNRYDLIPEYEKSRNWIFMNPMRPGEYVKVPLPLGPHIFHNAGRLLSDAMNRKDKRNASEYGWSMAGIFLDAFSPLGASQSVGQLIAPSILDPVVQVAENKSFTGGPVYKAADKGFGKTDPKPAYTRHFENTPDVWVGASKALNDLTGGDKVKPGLVNIEPDIFKHVFYTLTGGPGRALDRMVDTAQAPAHGREFTVNRVPIVSRFYGENDDAQRERAYYDDRKRAADAKTQFDYFIKQGRPELAREVAQELGEGNEAKGRQKMREFASADKAVRKINSAMRAELAKENPDKEAQGEQMKALRQRRLKVMSNALDNED